MKSQYAQEISAANLQIQDFQKTVEETMRRAEEAEAFQKSVQTELAEAKVVQKYNAQLHKDLQREQLARKKLHNDMEDMKGAFFSVVALTFSLRFPFAFFSRTCSPLTVVLKLTLLYLCRIQRPMI